MLKKRERTESYYLYALNEVGVMVDTPVDLLPKQVVVREIDTNTAFLIESEPFISVTPTIIINKDGFACIEVTVLTNPIKTVQTQLFRSEDLQYAPCAFLIVELKDVLILDQYYSSLLVAVGRIEGEC